MLINVSRHLLVLDGFTRYGLAFLRSLIGPSLKEIGGYRTSRGLSTILLRTFSHSSIHLCSNITRPESARASETCTSLYCIINDYSPKAKWILLNNPQDEVKGIIQQYSLSLRGIIVLVQFQNWTTENNGLKHKNRHAIVFLHTRMQQ